MSANPQRFDNIEIPERPAVTSETPADGRLRKGVLLWGGIAAVALVVLAVIAAVFSGHGEKVARLPAEAPLIKPDEQPIKVTPESPGGMQVPNWDMMVYERMHGSPGSKPPVERLLPEPEQPLAPPQPKPSAPPAEPPALAQSGSPFSAASELPPAGKTSAGTPQATVPLTSDVPAAVVPSTKPPTAATTQPKPAPSAKPTTTEKKPAPVEKPAKNGTARYQVQLLAGRSADEVRSAWTKLKAQNADLLGPLSPTLAPTDLGERGTYFRLRAGPLESEAKARALCDRLSGRGASCIIIRPGG